MSGTSRPESVAASPSSSPGRRNRTPHISQCSARARSCNSDSDLWHDRTLGNSAIALAATCDRHGDRRRDRRIGVSGVGLGCSRLQPERDLDGRERSGFAVGTTFGITGQGNQPPHPPTDKAAEGGEEDLASARHRRLIGGAPQSPTHGDRPQATWLPTGAAQFGAQLTSRSPVSAFTPGSDDAAGTDVSGSGKGERGASSSGAAYARHACDRRRWQAHTIALSRGTHLTAARNSLTARSDVQRLDR